MCLPTDPAEVRALLAPPPALWVDVPHHSATSQTPYLGGEMSKPLSQLDAAQAIAVAGPPPVRGQAFLLLMLLWLGLAASARPPLTLAQKEALAEAWHAGYHVGLPLTFAAIVYVESKACADAHKSAKGAVGCAQVMPATANEVAQVTIPEWQLSSSDFTDENLGIGAHYLQECMLKFGWPAGIGCYDYGLHTKLTRRQLAHARYTRAVLAAMKWLRNLPQSDD